MHLIFLETVIWEFKNRARPSQFHFSLLGCKHDVNQQLGVGWCYYWEYSSVTADLCLVSGSDRLWDFSAQEEIRKIKSEC